MTDDVIKESHRELIDRRLSRVKEKRKKREKKNFRNLITANEWRHSFELEENDTLKERNRPARS